MPNLVFFDLETQKLLQEVGGRANIRFLRMSCAVTYSTQAGTFRTYEEKEAADLIRELTSADRVIGFNIKHFDYEVLKFYAPFQRWDKVPTLDLCEEVERGLGFRLGLDALASATLGAAKLADGLQAVQWFRQGLFDRLREYCQADVEITRRLYEYGCANGFVYYVPRGGFKTKLPVQWQVDPSTP